MASFISSPAPAPVMPKAQQLSILVDQMQRSSGMQFKQVLDSTKRGWEAVWENPNGLTPQEVLAAMGTSAVASFATHAAAVVFLEAVAAANGMPDPLDAKYKGVKSPVTIAADGSVTVNP